MADAGADRFPEDTRVNLERFLETLDASSGIGAGREGGMARLALGDADKQMRDLFVCWCREAGLAVRIDGLGNIFARRAGRDEVTGTGPRGQPSRHPGQWWPLLTGSSALLGALELVRRLDDLGHRTRRPIEIVNWTNEEGGRFSPPMTCSGGFAGVYDIDWVKARRADDGPTLGEELERIGYAGDAPVGGIAARFLFRTACGAGARPSIRRESMSAWSRMPTRRMVFACSLPARPPHAGPWPMEKRRNALIAAATPVRPRR